MLRSAILAAARSARLERAVQAAPLTRSMVRRFVAGTTTADALRVTGELVGEGLTVTLDYLGEDCRSTEDAGHTREEYVRLLAELGSAGHTGAGPSDAGSSDAGSSDAGHSDAGHSGANPSGARVARAEVSVKLSALGQKIDERIAYDHVHAICAAATAAGTTVTLDMEDHTTTDSTLEILARLRKDFPATGAVLQSYLRRTEGDCRELATPGSRVRLCKGAYDEPESVAYQSTLDVDRSYVRCLTILMSGKGYPMLATHDPRLVAIGEDRAGWFHRGKGDFEFQMLYGVRPDEQRRLAAAGYAVRVYVPYGTQWYGYLMRRLAERPANLVFFLRALKSRR